MCFDCTDLKVGPANVCSQADVLVCDGHADLGIDADLFDDHHLVQYLVKIIRRREELGAELYSISSTNSYLQMEGGVVHHN